ncbi:Proteasome subunit beta type-1 [Apophysomyces ossiformis]|uniref:Proteasome subunit beta type-1 n=1 Tax=Apophysomyces ossiformis TaxID=679940 RepID=A0A8H7EUN2_9FUNG|nr:Proteasome subunit beta type-1 [Apophysomyces ossiformis]
MECTISNPLECTSAPIEHRFEPYDDNGGTSLAIAGDDFCVVASDTRQSTGYSINSRFTPKAYKLSETSVLAANGFHADGLTLKKVLEQRLKVGRKNQQNAPNTSIQLDEAIRIVKDAFTSATERDIYTGDSLQIFIIRKGQEVEVLNYPLKRD